MDLKKIKIAHVLHSVGGVDIYVRFVLENIDNCKFCSVVLHGKNDTHQPFLDKDKEPVKSYRTSIVRDISFIKDLKGIFEIYNILKKERPDIIHAHSAKGGIMGRIVGRLLNIKVIHTPHAFSYLSAETKIKRKIFILLEMFFSKGYGLLLATSNSELNRGLNEVKFDPKDAFYLNNSINPINNIPNLSIPRTWPKEYICTVGRPSYQKNIELMINILEKINEFREVHLVIMGVGPVSYRLSNVQDLIKKKNLDDKITLINWTNRDNILNIINDSRFYISTSRYEGMPYSIIESLALSKPCLVSNCDGNVDLIKDGFNGFIVSDENIDAFVEKAFYLLSDEKALKQFSNNAFTSFNEDYNISKNILKLEEFYKDHSINN
jgi:glycosyltransferase involved in cell wall biosynthesis